MGVAELGATVDQLRQLGARMIRHIPFKIGLVQPIHRNQQDMLDPRLTGRMAGRLALVRAVEEGSSLKAAAAAFKVSPATAHRWWHRWLDGGC